jgi:hypothetical protein
MANNKAVGVAYSDPALTAFYLNAPVTETASFILGDEEIILYVTALLPMLQ